MAEYIEREAIRDALYDADAITMGGVKILNRFSPSDVEPVRHAHWEYWDGWMSNHDMRLECACSACGYKAVVRGYGYDNDLGKKELYSEITEYNCDVAEGKIMQDNICVYILYSDVYDELELIEFPEE